MLSASCGIDNYNGFAVHLLSVQASAVGPRANVHIEAVDDATGNILVECSTHYPGTTTQSCSDYRVFDPAVRLDSVSCYVFGVLAGSYSCSISI